MSELPLGIYEHYKGRRYRVMGVAKHSETLEKHVVYQHVDERDIWVRPLSMFLESVNGVPRFRLIENS